jgi:putative DNA primase/helicase
MPGAVSGQGGHNQTFRAACVLVRNFALQVKEALPLLREWNETCQPPWSERELLHKLEDAEKVKGPRGDLLYAGQDAENADQSGRPPNGPEANNPPREVGKEDDDPCRLARVILHRRFGVVGQWALRYWHQQWWRWDEGAYRAREEAELRALVWGDLEAEFERLAAAKAKEKPTQQENGKTGPKKRKKVRKVNTALVSNVLEAMTHPTLVDGTVEQPGWLGTKKKGESNNFLAMQNGLVDVEKLLRGEPEVLQPLTVNWFSTVCLPFKFDEKAGCPKWEAFLKTNLEGDEERIALLQEFFGYCLTPNTSRQCFLMLEGEGGNGKSVVCAALTAVLGEGNVSHVPLEAFAQRFALTQTLGKLANIASEVGEIDRVAEGLLKSFTAGDRMMFDRKGIDPIEAMPTARLVLATNNRPRFSDRSGGLWRRLLLMSRDTNLYEVKGHELLRA